MGLLLAISLCGCGVDDAPSADPDPVPAELVQRARPQTQPDVSQPRHSGVPTTPKPLGPPVESFPAKPAPAQQPIFRPSYARTEHDETQLATFGLSRFSTEHLELITDLPRDEAEPLVTLVDALQPFLEDYFGKLPPARDGSGYRITGFVMEDRNRFVQARLAKADLLDSFHGRQIGAEFWMNNQTLDYYRRHLLLHEAVHCYMRHLPGETGFPMWYLEGMAEMIATHHRRIDEPESDLLPSTPPPEFTFNVMPVDRMRFRGLERIVILQRDVKQNGVLSIARIRRFTGDDFKDSIEPYAWCWALCRFLDSHPTTQLQFRKLAKGFIKTPPAAAIESFFANAGMNLEMEWSLFAADIEHAYDFPAQAIAFQAGEPLERNPHVTEISSSKGWQSTRLLVVAGTVYEISAAGQFTLAPGERPWVSEANGISIRYHNGQPLGRLLGAVHVAGKPHSMMQTILLGNEARFTATQTGTLYLKVNDWPYSVSDNQGRLSVSIRKAE